MCLSSVLFPLLSLPLLSLSLVSLVLDVSVLWLCSHSLVSCLWCTHTHTFEFTFGVIPCSCPESRGHFRTDETSDPGRQQPSIEPLSASNQTWKVFVYVFPSYTRLWSSPSSAIGRTSARGLFLRILFADFGDHRRQH